MGLGLATKAFFKILFDADAAAAFRTAIKPSSTPRLEPGVTEKPQKQPKSIRPRRNDAISLLAALQRESRLLDLVQEPLDNFTDEQVGAAARGVLSDAGKVIDRMFAIKPLTESEEGSELETPKSVDPGRYRLTGNVHGDAPFRGSLVHHGWAATQCDLPTWSGSEDSALIVAPIELEIS